MTARFGLKRNFSRGIAAVWLLAAAGIAGVVISSGCGDVTTTATDTGGNPTTPPAGGSNEPIDLSTVTWVHGKNIGDFPVTAKLGKVTFERGVNVCSDGMSWPSNWSGLGTKNVNANHVVLAKINGKWYGGAWEAMMAGIARCRPMETIKNNQSYKWGPFGQVEQDPFWTWYPKKGEKIGFMVTSWIRSGTKQPTGRSHVVMAEWPY